MPAITQLRLRWDDVLADEAVLGWMLAASVLTFVATLAFIPYIVVRLPPDYFSRDRRRAAEPVGLRGQVTHWLMLGFKNVVGALFVVMGITMLVLPGQGMLTILIGLSLLNFPGKYRLERWIVTRPTVSRGLNWLRRRSGKQPFQG